MTVAHSAPRNAPLADSFGISRRRFLAAAGAGALTPLCAWAADYPVRPVRMIVGQAPGGQTDTIARAVAQKLGERWGVPVLVENQAGAAGSIAVRTVIQAPADGYTLLVGSPANLVQAPVVNPDIVYDPIRDLAPIGRIARVTYVLVVRSVVPAATLAQFLALARARPEAISVGTVGLGSNVGIILERLSSAAGVRFLDVPYKGAAPLVLAMVAGQVDATVCDLSLVQSHVASGTLRLLAMVGAQRSALAPGVPTLRESGYADLGTDPWYGVAAPAGTPAPVIGELSDALRAAVRDPDLRKRFAPLGYEVFDEAPADFARDLATEIEQARSTYRSARQKASR